PSFIYLTFLLLLPPPRSTLFPYTTFFRSHFKSETKRLNLKGLVRANKAGCLDHCEMGPSVVIYPEGVWYWVGTEADVTEIMERHVMKGEIVSRLLMPDHPAPEKLAPLKKD